MNKRAVIFITGFIVIATILTVGLIALNQSDKPEAMANSGNHDTSNMANQSDQDIGQIVDLTSQPEVTMNIKDYKYQKPNIKIKKGTKVTWINQDVIQHNVMLEHEGSDKAHNAPTKEEVDPNELAGPLLAKGESYSFTFNEVTANPYHCSPHPFMKGSVTVVE